MIGIAADCSTGAVVIEYPDSVDAVLARSAGDEEIQPTATYTTPKPRVQHAYKTLGEMPRYDPNAKSGERR